MSVFIQSIVKRSAVVALVAALAFTGVAPAARAQTADAAAIAALQAQIAVLIAQIATLQGGASASMTFTRDLTIGSTGADVTSLQQWLIARGYSIPAGATGYFGTQTQAAVAAYQRASGIAPPAGYFGPITRARVNATVVVTPPTTPPSDNDDDDLRGGAGSIDSYELLSGLNNEEVGEGEEDVEVAGLEIEVDDGSDIEITAVRLTFNEGTANRDFDRYADEVSLWLDGEEVARVDADKFDDDNNWSSNVSLDSGAIIRRGDTGELTVAITGISNLDSNDEGETWTVDFEQIRFRDADGAIISENPSTGTRTFSFEEFASAAGVGIKISDGDEDINDSRVITVDEDDDTDNVEIFSFMMEIEGNSDITLDSLPVAFTVTGTAADLEDAVSEVVLYMDGDEVGSENTTNGVNTVVFNDLDLELEAGEEYEFVVLVTINDLSASLAEGDTIEATIGETETDSADFDAEDESGDDVSDADITGSATGGAHSLSAIGIEVAFVSASQSISNTADTAGEGDQGSFTITFDVAAGDDDIRLDRSCEEDNGVNAAGQGIEYTVSNNGSNTTLCSLSSSSSDSEDTANTFEVDSGKTRRFSLNVVATASADHFAQVEMTSINWGTATDDTNANYYTFNLDEFQTGVLFLNYI